MSPTPVKACRSQTVIATFRLCVIDREPRTLSNVNSMLYDIYMLTHTHTQTVYFTNKVDFLLTNQSTKKNIYIEIFSSYGFIVK